MGGMSHVILTWNLWDITSNLLNSLYNYTDHKYLEDVIIVDNGSTDSTIEILRAYYPKSIAHGDRPRRYHGKR